MERKHPFLLFIPALAAGIAVLASDSYAYDPIRITPSGSNEAAPVLSWDGQTIYFESNRTGHYHLYQMPVGGGTETQLTDGSDDERFPALSWDGLQLAFARYPGGAANSAIYVLSLETGGVRQVTFNAGPDDADQYPEWSPDGSTIYFVHRTGALGDWHIMRVPIQGGVPVAFLALSGNQTGPHMAGDATRFVFASNHVGGVWNLFECRLRNLSLTQLTFGISGSRSLAAWSYAPDSGRILYSSVNTAYQEDLFELDRTTLVSRRITYDGCGNSGDPASRHGTYSPDGNDMYFSSRRTGDFDVWRLAGPQTPPPVSLVCPAATTARLTPGAAYSFTFGLCNFGPAVSVPWCLSDRLGWITPQCRSASLSGGSSANIPFSGTIPLNASLCDTNVFTFTATTAEGPRSCTVKVPLQTSAPPPNPAGIITLFTPPTNVAHYSPCWTPDGESIIYTSSEQGDGRLWKRPVAGGPEVKISDFTGYWTIEGYPRVSPDGSRIVFSRRTGVVSPPDQIREDIMVIPVSGGPATQITWSGWDYIAHVTPEWSADGSRIYFIQLNRDTGVSRLMSVASTGDVGNPLIPGLSGSQTQPRASHDGLHLAFASNHLGGALNVFECDLANPSVLRQLTFETENTAPDDYSPDDSRILCSTRKFNGHLELLEVHRGDLSQTRFSYDGDGPTESSAYGAYSPDGSRIAYSARRLDITATQVWMLEPGPIQIPVCADCPPAIHDPVTPGEPVSLPFRFCNCGVVTERYAFRIADDLGWSPAVVDTVELPPGQSYEATLILTGSPPTRPSDPDTNHVRFHVAGVGETPVFEECVVALPVAPVPVSTLLSRFQAESRSDGVDIAFEFPDRQLHLCELLRREANMPRWTLETPSPLRVVRHGSFLDSRAVPGTRYIYRLQEMDSPGSREIVGEVTLTYSPPLPPFGIRPVSSIPFSSRLDMVMDLPERCGVTVRVFDVSGRTVRTLFQDSSLEAGSTRLTWNGRTDDGGLCGSGIYFVRATASGPGKHPRTAILRALHLR